MKKFTYTKTPVCFDSACLMVGHEMKGTANDCRTVKTGSLRVCGSYNILTFVLSFAQKCVYVSYFYEDC